MSTAPGACIAEAAEAMQGIQVILFWVLAFTCFYNGMKQELHGGSLGPRFLDSCKTTRSRPFVCAVVLSRWLAWSGLLGWGKKDQGRSLWPCSSATQSYPFLPRNPWAALS